MDQSPRGLLRVRPTPWHGRATNSWILMKHRLNRFHCRLSLSLAAGTNVTRMPRHLSMASLPSTATGTNVTSLPISPGMAPLLSMAAGTTVTRLPRRTEHRCGSALERGRWHIECDPPTTLSLLPYYLELGGCNPPSRGFIALPLPGCRRMRCGPHASPLHRGSDLELGSLCYTVT